MNTALRLTVAGLIAALTGCASPDQVTVSPAEPPPAAPQTNLSPSKRADGVFPVGRWAKTDDGMQLMVVSLKRGAVADEAAVHAGDPAVVVTLKITNKSTARFPLEELAVTSKLGVDSREAEEVYQGPYGQTLTGSLPPGRSSTSRYMFAAEDADELDDVTVNVSLGHEYAVVPFEGSVR